MSDREPCQFGFDPPCDACLPCVMNAYRDIQEEHRVLREAVAPIVEIDLKKMSDAHLDQITERVRAAPAKRPSNPGPQRCRNCQHTEDRHPFVLGDIYCITFERPSNEGEET